MKLKPLFNRVLLKREKFKTSSIIIPDEAAKRNARCLGVAKAKGHDADDSIKVGATYIFGVHAGAWVDEEGRQNADGEFFITNDEDLLCEVA